MTVAIRNLGRDGLVATAISAIDAAIWDLKAKLLDAPLAMLFGRFRNDATIYGSGGFTNFTDAEMCRQLANFVERDGCAFVKMKVGSQPERNAHRVRLAKRAIGDRALFVDANGAYQVKQALELAQIFAAEANVRWFEEPVSSDDLDGLAFLRGMRPP